MSTLACKPVTKATKADFEALFGGKGGPKPCWCMTWRASAEEIRTDNSGEARKKAILGRIDEGVPLGLIGYAEGEPVDPKSPSYRFMGFVPAFEAADSRKSAPQAPAALSCG